MFSKVAKAPIKFLKNRQSILLQNILLNILTFFFGQIQPLKKIEIVTKGVLFLFFQIF